MHCMVFSLQEYFKFLSGTFIILNVISILQPKVDFYFFHMFLTTCFVLTTSTSKHLA